MNELKELREKKISLQQRIKNDAMKQAKQNVSVSYQITLKKEQIQKATGEKKIQLQNEMYLMYKQLINHSFQCIYNRKYSDTDKYKWPQNKIKIIMDYDFPLK